MIFAVCGGDGRQERLAGLLLADGHTVRTWALDKAELPDGTRRCRSAVEALEGADCLLLPMPVSTRSGLLNAPLSESTHCLGEIFAAVGPGTLACGGMPGAEVRAVAGGRGIRLRDYGAREELLAANAVATAEGAIGVLLGEMERTIWHSRVLITGWGHIGRALAPRLRAMGANVCVCARSPGTRAWIEAAGLKCADARDFSDILTDCDIVINTVPAPMLTAARIAELGPQALILDLASAPGGTDFEAARAFGIRALTAPGLPGKWSPQTAAEIVLDAVYNILEDEKA